MFHFVEIIHGSKLTILLRYVFVCDVKHEMIIEHQEELVRGEFRRRNSTIFSFFNICRASPGEFIFIPQQKSEYN